MKDSGFKNSLYQLSKESMVEKNVTKINNFRIQRKLSSTESI